MRYGPNVLPRPLRMQDSVDRMRERIKTRHDERESLGFLMAYVGHQTEDAPMVAEGLGIMRKAAADPTFVTLLEAIWVSPDVPPMLVAPEATPSK